jgi:hypothetical protein
MNPGPSKYRGILLKSRGEELIQLRVALSPKLRTKTQIL